jgi:putative transposase
MIEKDDTIPITKQCEILTVSRRSVYYQPTEKMTENIIDIMHAIDRTYTEYPFFGHRRVCDELKE